MGNIVEYAQKQALALDVCYSGTGINRHKISSQLITLTKFAYFI